MGSKGNKMIIYIHSQQIQNKLKDTHSEGNKSLGQFR